LLTITVAGTTCSIFRSQFGQSSCRPLRNVLHTLRQAPNMYDLTMGYDYRRPHKGLSRFHNAYPASWDLGGFNAYPTFGGVVDTPYFGGGAYTLDAQMQNSIEDATRAHVEAKMELEKVKEKYDEARKKFEECEKKVREAELRLRWAKGVPYS
jgi:hypothetical protein